MSKKFKPSPKQQEFFDSKKLTKFLVGCRNSGISKAIMQEVIYHATGQYPKKWKGRKFEHGVKIDVLHNCWIKRSLFIEELVSRVNVKAVQDCYGTKQEFVKEHLGKLGTTITVDHAVEGLSEIRFVEKAILGSYTERHMFRQDVDIIACDCEVEGRVDQYIENDYKDREVLVMHGFELRYQSGILESSLRDKNISCTLMGAADITWKVK